MPSFVVTRHRPGEQAKTIVLEAKTIDEALQTAKAIEHRAPWIVDKSSEFFGEDDLAQWYVYGSCEDLIENDPEPLIRRYANQEEYDAKNPPGKWFFVAGAVKVEPD